MNKIGYIAGTIALAAVTTLFPTNIAETSQVETTRVSRTQAQAQTIQTGDWSMSGPGMFDVLIVQIDETTYGRAVVEEIDGGDLAAEMGFPLVGESASAPRGCRLFVYSGPFQLPMFVGLCATSDYALFVGGTDRDAIDAVMLDFVEGVPFTIPHGYYLD